MVVRCRAGSARRVPNCHRMPDTRWSPLPYGRSFCRAKLSRFPCRGRRNRSSPACTCRCPRCDLSRSRNSVIRDKGRKRRAPIPGRRRHRRPPRDTTDSGSMTVELVVLAPVVVAFLLFTLALGRYTSAREQVAGGTSAAAEAAAVAPSLSQARAAAVAAASPALQSLHSCRNPSIQVVAGNFAPGAEIRVVVSCRVDYADLLVPGMPGSTTVTSVEDAVIDPYRAVSP